MIKIYTVLFLLVATTALINYSTREKDQPNTAPAQITTAQNYALPQITPEQYLRRELADGGVLFERQAPKQGVQPRTDQLDQIAPAAGNAPLNVFYEPLTQTFRRTVIDSEGNTRQEIIKHPANR